MIGRKEEWYQNKTQIIITQYYSDSNSNNRIYIYIIEITILSINK